MVSYLSVSAGILGKNRVLDVRVVVRRVVGAVLPSPLSSNGRGSSNPENPPDKINSHHGAEVGSSRSVLDAWRKRCQKQIAVGEKVRNSRDIGAEQIFKYKHGCEDDGGNSDKDDVVFSRRELSDVVERVDQVGGNRKDNNREDKLVKRCELQLLAPFAAL